MRSKIAACCLLASLVGMGTAGAAECPADALGVSRTLVVDPTEHPRLGSFQYGESLPLKDHEVVLTFDDGPLPTYTDRVLDVLASECVKATFFMVGKMVQAYPAAVRRVYDEGHTIANHSQTHPFTFHKMSVQQAATEIEGGFASLRGALGEGKSIAPFFRFPGLLRQTAVEQYLASRKVMAWSVDLVADDWTHINNREIARRAISRLEARGKGILLLHDIHAATALALPEILHELKARGFKVVHVVPASPDRPKTVTEPELWAVRHSSPEDKLWPRTLVMFEGPPPPPVLAAPSPLSFGIESTGPVVRIALAQTFEQPVAEEGAGVFPSEPPWPAPVVYAVPPGSQVLPVPSALNFRYSRPFRPGQPDKPKVAAKKPVTAAKPREAARPSSMFGGWPGGTRGGAYGHQLSVARPPTNLAAPQVR